MAASQATYTLTSPPNPALTPPPGVIPNFQQPYTLQPYVELTIAGGIAITSALIAARLFVKIRLMKKWLWEDWTCIFGWLLMWVNTLFYAIAFFLAIFGCRPRRKIWSPEIPGHCLDSKSLYITSASFNTLSDISMLSILVHMVWSLQMSTKRKIGISGIFGTGVFACICSVVRIFFEVKLTRTKDFTYVHMETGLLGYAEVACGIICACLPLLPLCWHHLSRSTGGGGHITLGPMNRSPQHGQAGYAPSRATRAWSEATDALEPVKGKNWVKLEDGTIVPLPKGHHVQRGGSDEQALTEAIIGIH
ncbi:MAG: hypothetical protein Q9181_001409 [Wetmoreana brouardii]